MCFTWAAADGFGPIWIFGDRRYVDALEELDSHNVKVKVRVRPLTMPNWTNSEEMEIKEVNTKNIDTTRYAVTDKSPHPPPSYFTWAHLYKRERGKEFIATLCSVRTNCSNVGSPFRSFLGERNGGARNLFALVACRR